MPRVPRKTTRRTGAKLNERQKRQVKTLIGHSEESKNVDQNQNSTSIPAAAGVILGSFFTPAQGTNEDQRIGNQITQKMIEMKYSVSAGDATNFVRVIIFKWYTDNNVEIPTAADVLQDIVNNTWLAPYNDRSIEGNKIHIMHDRVHCLNVQGIANVAVSLKIFGRKLGRKVQTFSTAGIVGHNQTYFLCVSDSIAAAHPTIVAYGRQHFTDS